MIDLLTEIYRTALSGFWAFVGTWLLLALPAKVIIHFWHDLFKNLAIAMVGHPNQKEKEKRMGTDV